MIYLPKDAPFSPHRSLIKSNFDKVHQQLRDQGERLDLLMCSSSHADLFVERVHYYSLPFFALLTE